MQVSKGAPTFKHGSGGWSWSLGSGVGVGVAAYVNPIADFQRGGYPITPTLTLTLNLTLNLTKENPTTPPIMACVVDTLESVRVRGTS